MIKVLKLLVKTLFLLASLAMTFVITVYIALTFGSIDITAYVKGLDFVAGKDINADRISLSLSKTSGFFDVAISNLSYRSNKKFDRIKSVKAEHINFSIKILPLIRHKFKFKNIEAVRANAKVIILDKNKKNNDFDLKKFYRFLRRSGRVNIEESSVEVVDKRMDEDSLYHINKINLSLFDDNDMLISHLEFSGEKDGHKFGGKSKGSIKREGDNFIINSVINIAKAPTVLVKESWPVDVGPKARKWVTHNIKKGFVSDVNVIGEFKLSPDDFSVNSIEGDFKLNGISLRYMDTQPWINDIEAKATFTKTTMNFDISKGKLGSQNIKDINAYLYDLDTNKEQAVISLKDVSGDFGEVLKLVAIEEEKLRNYLAMKGRGSYRGKISFELKQKVDFKDVNLDLVADVSDYKITKIGKFNDLHISGKDMSIVIKDKMLKAKSDGLIDGHPLKISYQRRLFPDNKTKAKNTWASKLSMDSSANVKALKDFGYDLSSYVTGAVHAKFNLVQYWDDNGIMTINMDFTPSVIKFRPLNIFKQRKRVAKFYSTILLIDDEIREIKDIKIISDNGIDLVGSAKFNPERNIWSNIRIEGKYNHFNKLKVSFSEKDKDNYDISVYSSNVNLKEFLDKVLDSKNKNPYLDIKNLNIRLKFDSVYNGYSKLFNTTSLNMLMEKGFIKNMDLVANYAEHVYKDEPLKASIKTINNRQFLDVILYDLEKILKSFDWGRNLKGKRTTIVAERDISDRFNPSAWSGKFRIRHFGFPNISDLSKADKKIISEYSSKDKRFIETMKKVKYFNFTTFKSKFTYKDGVLKLKNATMSGDDIGAAYSGEIVFGDDENYINIKGTIIPAYTLNAIISHIPIVGLFLGGRGNGILSMNFTLKGPFSNPRFSINPLSIIAPGFLRELFPANES